MNTADSSSNASQEGEKTLDQRAIEDPDLLNQPPFNIPPGAGSRPNGLLQPPGSGVQNVKARSRSSLAGLTNRHKSTPRADGKRELTEDDCYDILAYSWPKWKKWGFLSVRTWPADIALSQRGTSTDDFQGNCCDTNLDEFQHFRLPQCRHAHLRSFWCE